MPASASQPRKAVLPDAQPKLEKFEAAFRARWAMLLAGGALVTLIAPTIIAAVYRVREMFRFQHDQHSYLHHFLIVSLIAVPIMFILARLVGSHLADRAADSVDVSGAPYTRHLGGRLIFGLAIFDMMLWGPRMVLLGAARLWSLRAHASADREFAARILAILLARSEGIHINELAAIAPATPDKFGDALAYLTFLEITDIAKDGDRVWLQSLARDQIERM